MLINHFFPTPSLQEENSGIIKNLTGKCLKRMKKNGNKMLLSLPTYTPSKEHSYRCVLLSSTSLDTFLFVTEIKNGNGITRVKEITSFPVLLFMHIRKENNSLSPVFDSCFMFIYICSDLSSLHVGHWRERGCRAGCVTVSVLIDVCCFTEDLCVWENRNNLYIWLF